MRRKTTVPAAAIVRGRRHSAQRRDQRDCTPEGRSALRERLVAEASELVLRGLGTSVSAMASASKGTAPAGAGSADFAWPGSRPSSASTASVTTAHRSPAHPVLRGSANDLREEGEVGGPIRLDEAEGRDARADVLEEVALGRHE